jgi:hypothetical protein
MAQKTDLLNKTTEKANIALVEMISLKQKLSYALGAGVGSMVAVYIF